MRKVTKEMLFLAEDERACRIKREQLEAKLIRGLFQYDDDQQDVRDYANELASAYSRDTILAVAQTIFAETDKERAAFEKMKEVKIVHTLLTIVYEED